MRLKVTQNVPCDEQQFEKWYKIKLPYQAPNYPRIPSLAEIQKAFAPRSDGFTPQECIVDNCVIKQSSDPSVIQEAETLMFLHNILGLRVPQVYAAFKYYLEDWQGDIYFHAVEVPKGEFLSRDKWATFDDEIKNVLCSKLAKQFEILRSIPQEGGSDYYGRVNRGPWATDMPAFKLFGYETRGPFDSYQQLFSAMIDSAQLVFATSHEQADYYPHEVKSLGEIVEILGESENTRPCFTHMYPSLNNILVRPICDPSGAITDWDVALWGWKHAGWFPAYVQTVQLHKSFLYLGKDAAESTIERIVPHWRDSCLREVELMGHGCKYKFAFWS
ncbi:hypothetical protein BU24DRAFT_355964 [Aaosphaeria arxii CBS 175.79]|uniref:Aminoglycoside phosphotransferase domain-containing protein n=1 Tax=Aaosphaeria arxii CBS 175.79 TaxID=1450172 RepID=A0A6A5XDN6_9PLEO|nr:uncharacterized protein BU24DRAFT_355964 [Aaosphaeria arxii CBS 175.79]KAF2010983.1 hypothetical protein BU24DRAFT_355964 [Aaosphaeria arxii CBS 175.79]